MESPITERVGLKLDFNLVGPITFKGCGVLHHTSDNHGGSGNAGGFRLIPIQIHPPSKKVTKLLLTILPPPLTPRRNAPMIS